MAAVVDRKKLADGGDAKKWDAETPASLQVIKAGATALTTAWTKRARTAGGGVAAASIVAGGVGAFFRDLGVPTAVACTLVAGGAAIAVAVVIGITAFLSAQQPPSNGSMSAAETALMSAIASPWTVSVATRDDPGTRSVVTGVKRTSNGLRFVTAKDQLGIGEIMTWSTDNSARSGRRSRW